MPSPVHFEKHSSPHVLLCNWLGHYAAYTSLVRVGDNGSVRLDLDNMVQPDAFLFIDLECGGQVRISADDYIEGAPELVAEVSSSSASHDLHEKLNVYRRSGVREYIVWRVLDQQVDWFVLDRGRYAPLPPSPDGISRSPVFGGLWRDSAALLLGDLAKVLTVLQQGLQSPEHANFVRGLAEIKAKVGTAGPGSPTAR
jgi:Uma2 family endonuclease